MSSPTPSIILNRDESVKAGCAHVFLRPAGDEVAAIYGKYMSSTELKKLKVGDTFEVLCTDGLNYYVDCKSISPDGDCVLHFRHWGKEYDYCGPLSALYAAPLGKYSEGISAINTYSKDLFQKAKPSNRKRRIGALSFDESNSASAEKNYSGEPVAASPEDKIPGTAVESVDNEDDNGRRTVITHAGSGVLFRPDGDKIARSFGPHFSKREVAKLQCGQRVDVLCADRVHYTVEIKSISDDGNMGHIHFLNWSSRWDYRGSLQQLYFAEKEQYISEIDDSGAPRGKRRPSRALSERSIALAKSRRYPDDFFSAPKLQFTKRSSRLAPVVGYSLRARNSRSTRRPIDELDEIASDHYDNSDSGDSSPGGDNEIDPGVGDDNDARKSVKKSVKSVKKSSSLLSRRARGAKANNLINPEVILAFSSEVGTEAETDFRNRIADSCIRAQQFMELFIESSLLSSSKAIELLSDYPDVGHILRAVRNVYSSVDCLRSDAEIGTSTIPSDGSLQPLDNSSSSSMSQPDFAPKGFTLEEWKELLVAKRAIDFAIWRQLYGASAPKQNCE